MTIDDTTTDASTPTRSAWNDLSTNSGDTPTPIPLKHKVGGTSTTNPLSNGGGRTTLPSPPASPAPLKKRQLPVGVSPPAPPSSDADLQALGLPTNLNDLPPDDVAGVLEALEPLPPPLNPVDPSSTTSSLLQRSFGEVGPPALPNLIDPALLQQPLPL